MYTYGALLLRMTTAQKVPSSRELKSWVGSECIVMNGESGGIPKKKAIWPFEVSNIVWPVEVHFINI